MVAAAEVDGDACRALGVPVYRRFSGGGAVYHDAGNLNVSLVLPRGDPLLGRAGRTLHDLYALVLEPLRFAVSLLGCEVAVGRDLMLGGRKLSGVAVWQNPAAVLVHATLLVDADLNALDRVLAGPGAPDDARWRQTRSRRVPVTSLARHGIPPSALEDVDERVIAAFAAFEANAARAAGRPARTLAADAPTRAEDEAMLVLFERRYSRPAWHWSGAEEEVMDRARAAA